MLSLWIRAALFLAHSFRTVTVTTVTEVDEGGEKSQTVQERRTNVKGVLKTTNCPAGSSNGHWSAISIRPCCHQTVDFDWPSR